MNKQNHLSYPQSLASSLKKGGELCCATCFPPFFKDGAEQKGQPG